MGKDRKSACSVSSFEGPEHLQAEPKQQVKFNADNIGLQPALPKKIKGNRCGYSKNKLKVPLFLRKASKRAKHPLAIESAIKVSRSCLQWLYSSRKRRKELLQSIQPDTKKIQSFAHVIDLFQSEKLRWIFYHLDKKTKKGHARRKRGEAVVAIVRDALAALFNYCDLLTMAIGIRHNAHTFHYKSYAYLAEKAGCSLTQIKRAMQFLQRIGLVTVNVITKELDDGHIFTLRTEIYLSEEAFFIFGLKDQFLKDREYAIQKYEKAIDRKESREKRMEAFRSYDRQKNKKRVHYLNQSVKGIIKTPRSTSDYNPASDKRVLALAGELLASKLCDNMRDAITLASTKLGKPPPH